MKSTIKSALLYLFFLTIILGVFYPLVITDVAQLLFPERANGSLVLDQGKVLGSMLIGQKFEQPGYFSSRPSAVDYNTLPGAGSNLGPTSLKLKNLVQERRRNFYTVNGVTDTLKIPPEMLFASGSGLDPHISPRAALMQTDRISRSRNFNEAEKSQLRDLVVRLSEKPQFLIFGEERVNVFALNLELDKLR